MDMRLAVEMTAAKVMLDAVILHCPAKNVRNVYTLGSVSDHNMVVACLPSGLYGTTSALFWPTCCRRFLHFNMH
jgi:hypothetical protein